MRPDELLAFVRARPFAPLRLHCTDGTTYDVHHPDQVIVLRGRVDVAVGADCETGAAERVDRVSLPDVVRVEQLSASTT
jgi:hypothetical protein